MLTFSIISFDRIYSKNLVFNMSIKNYYSYLQTYKRCFEMYKMLKYVSKGKNVKLQVHKFIHFNCELA